MPVEVSTGGTAIANEYYQVEYSLAECLDQFAHRELGTGRELVNPGALLGLNAYIFDRYAHEHEGGPPVGAGVQPALDLIADRVTGEAAVVAAARDERARGEPDR